MTTEYETRSVLVRSLSILSDLHRGRQVTPDRILGLITELDELLGPDGVQLGEPKAWKKKLSSPVNGRRGVTRSTF